MLERIREPNNLPSLENYRMSTSPVVTRPSYGHHLMATRPTQGTPYGHPTFLWTPPDGHPTCPRNPLWPPNLPKEPTRWAPNLPKETT